MQILHKGFDTLTVAIKANIPPDLFDHLEAEKKRADEERHDVLVEFNGVKAAPQVTRRQWIPFYCQWRAGWGNMVFQETERQR